jgi:hypothetical protein
MLVMMTVRTMTLNRSPTPLAVLMLQACELHKQGHTKFTAIETSTTGAVQKYRITVHRIEGCSALADPSLAGAHAVLTAAFDRHKANIKLVCHTTHCHSFVNPRVNESMLGKAPVVSLAPTNYAGGVHAATSNCNLCCANWDYGPGKCGDPPVLKKCDFGGCDINCCACNCDCGCCDGRDVYSDCCPCSTCFPADAQTVLEDGSVKRMDELAIGDRVLTLDPATGKQAFSYIYMFGHQDALVRSPYVHVVTASGTSLRLTADHYAVVAGADGSWAGRLTLPGGQVTTNHSVWVTSLGAEPRLERVVSVYVRADTGLFNPYTLNGIIVVDGVMASSHSSSALDGVFNRLGVSIPDGYQVRAV